MITLPKETDVVAVKKVIEDFFDEPVKVVSKEHGIVQHPFAAWTPFVRVKDYSKVGSDNSFDVENHIFYNLDNPEEYKEWKDWYKEKVFNYFDEDGVLSLAVTVNKPWRLIFLKELLNRNIVSRKDFSTLLGRMFKATEFPHGLGEQAVIWSQLFHIWFMIADKNNLMDEEELKALADMPEEITIYRGYGEGGFKGGVAWTTNKDKAIWFADRAHIFLGNENGYVVEATVNKNNVLAYFSYEDTVIIPPETVEDAVEIYSCK